MDSQPLPTFVRRTLTFLLRCDNHFSTNHVPAEDDLPKSNTCEPHPRACSHQSILDVPILGPSSGERRTMPKNKLKNRNMNQSDIP